MKINEVEQSIGITKKNIRFYEQEGLLNPGRAANGYRDYTEEDVETLRQIKLLRRLDIPIEEIKQVLSGSITLTDCLRRHLIVLERKSKNLEIVQAFCGKMIDEDKELKTLSVEMLLTEMDRLEDGGVKFVDVRKKDKRERKKSAVISAAVSIVFMALFLAIMIWAMIEEPEAPATFMVFLISLPAIGIVGTVLALVERMKEIEGGELDEASKY